MKMYRVGEVLGPRISETVILKKDGCLFYGRKDVMARKRYANCHS